MVDQPIAPGPRIRVIRIFCSWRIEEQAENARQMSQRARQTVSRVSHDHGLFSSDLD
jgi:hypothetical protein